MRFFTTLVALASAALAASSVQAESATKNMSVAKSFFVTAPSCEGEKCRFSVKPGEELKLNWLNPVKGRINIDLVPKEGQEDLKKYSIAKKIAANNHDDSCDHDGQPSCGKLSWTVPKDAKAGLYSVQIDSVYKSGIQGVSDTVEILKSTSKTVSDKSNHKSHKRAQH